MAMRKQHGVALAAWQQHRGGAGWQRIKWRRRNGI